MPDQSGALTADELGLSQAPAPPMMGPLPQSPLLQHFLPTATLAEKLSGLGVLATSLLARQHSAGLAQGYAQAQHQQSQDDLYKAQLMQAEAQRQHERQQAANLQAIRDQEARRKVYMGAMAGIKNHLTAITDKETYDKQLEGYTGLMQQAGFNVQPNMLRVNAPFRPATATDVAKEWWTNFTKQPFNSKALSEDYQGTLAKMVDLPLNGKDKPLVRMPVAEVMTLAGHSPLIDPTTNDVFAMANAQKHGSFDQEMVNNVFAKFVAEHRRQPDLKRNVQDIQEIQTELLKAKKASAEASHITVNVGGPGALDPGGVEYAATQYRVTMTMPALGMGNAASRTAIINTAAKQARMLGQTPAVSIQKAAAFKADTAALTQMSKMRASAEAFENKALQQADIVQDLSDKVSRTQYPVINEALLSGKARIVGDTNTQLLFNALTTFTTEYAKIMEGSMGSVAASSDSARAAAAKLVSPGLNKQTLTKTLDLMRREMRLTVQGYDATIEHITQRQIGPSGAVTPGTLPTTSVPGTTPERFVILQKGQP